jgi:hypothetical protein
MTQDECKQRYVQALSDFLDAISSIDQETPATPVEEPKWWVDMMDDWRAVQPHYIAHKPATS